MPLEVIVYNLLGQPVKVVAPDEYVAGFNQLEINVSDLSSGLYTLHIANKSQKIMRKFTIVSN